MRLKIDSHATNVISKGWAIRGEDGAAVAYILGTDGGVFERMKGLFLHSQDLLEALENIRGLTDTTPLSECEAVIAMADKAINKAKGEV